MILKISKYEILGYLVDLINHLTLYKIEPIAATVEECEVPGTWTFKFTYKWTEGE